MFYACIKNKTIEGFYHQDIHGEQVCNTVYVMGGIKVDEELHQQLLSLGEVEFIGVKEEKLYTIADKSLFKKVDAVVDTSPQPPSSEQRISALEELMMGVI